MNRYVALIALAAALLLLGCSGDDAPAATATRASGQPEAETTAATPAPAVEPESSATPAPPPFELSEPPEVIFFNGNVITIEESQPSAEAIGVDGNLIVALGSDEDVMAVAGPETQLIDLDGRTLMPGFVDPHNHFYNAVFFGEHQDVIGTTYAEAQEGLIRAGTTSVANANVWPDALVRFLEFANSGGLRIRTSVYLGYNDNCGNPWPEGWYLEYPPITDPNAMLRMPGIKFFSDGGSCGAIALTVGLPGDLYLTTEVLAPAIVKVQEAGYQPIIHAVGDRALDNVLDAVEVALDGGPNVQRIRIEHDRVVRPDQRPRFGELGIIPVVFGQPPTCTILDGGAWSVLNQDGTPAAAIRSWLDNWRALIDANPGLPVAWKSDAPTHFPHQPLLHLWSLVTRDVLRDDGSLCEAPAWLEAGGVSVKEALRMMTINGAYALFMEEWIGSLRPGKFADLIVLSEDPLTAGPDTIRDIDVLLTMVGGTVEYCAPGAETVCP